MEEKTKKQVIDYPYLQKPVVIYERENGHKIVFAYKPGTLVNVSTWVKTGSINETPENNGISHFLEHLMFKGTKKHKAGYFDKTLESKGAIVNAATWKDYTFYYVTLPKGPKDEYFKLAIELHADMMLNPVIPPEEIGDTFDINNPNIKTKRERHVVTEEIRMREDQSWTRVYNLCNDNMYTKHPYKFDVIGTAKLIAEMPRETVLNYYKTFYTPQNMTTIIAGDFDFDKTLKLVLKHFDFKGRKNNPVKKNVPDKPTNKMKYIETKSDVTTGFLTAGWLLPEAKDTKSSILGDILAIVLGDGQSCRLYQNLIEKQEKPIFNLVSADFYTFRDGSNFFVQANFQADKKDDAINAVKSEIEKIYTEKITENELKKSVKKLKARFAETTETVSDIAETIGYYMTVCDDMEQVKQYIDVLENITVDDVKKFAKKYLILKKATFAVLLPEDK
ncbi:MAG: insulinase family protein [Candidatus Gastranaerophilales bacterium]|nr:insulinase family protein [Candidatus Gastranaerophilales bacterium]